jgi:hypothetical protein
MNGYEIAALLFLLALSHSAAVIGGWLLRGVMARTQLAAVVARVQQMSAEPALTPGQPTCSACAAPVPDNTLRQHDGRRLCPACKRGQAA